jgi:hypothetical protein
MSKIDTQLKDAFRRCRARIEQSGVRVYIDDIIDPNTGTFDGATIGIDYANDLEMSLFVLVHLFGHTVQWNTVPAYRTIDQRVKPFAPPEVIEEARVYEQNASRYGLTLLRQCGIDDRDQWISDWWGSDWSYLSHYYSTGVLGDWREFRKTGFPRLEALPIPLFTPAVYPPRFAF